MTARLVSPVTVGRGAELEAGSSALDRAIRQEPLHLLIAGEAGVGKTRYAAELAAMASDRGMRVLRGECAALGEGGLPYAPIVEALRELASSLEPAELDEVVGAAGPDLARLVPALASAPAELLVQQQWLQARLLEALLGLLSRLAARSPVLLIVEDLHWADPATLETIAFLVRNVRTHRLLVAMTFRSDELHRRHPLLPWLAEVERTGRVERVDLARLDLDHVRELLAAIAGGEPDAAVVERIHRRSDGNPFFVEELLAVEEERGGHGLSTTLREVLLARLARLPEEAGPVLAAAAVAGHRVGHDLLAAVVGVPETDLLAGLRAAVSGQILVSETGPAGDDGYAFRHALIQEVVYDELLPGERRRLHRACAEAIAARREPSGASAAAHWAELAHHWASARDDRRAFEASLRASEAAERTFAFETALRQYERAVDLWTDLEDPEALAGTDRAELLSRAARAATIGGFPHRSAALRREAIAALDPAADPVRSAVMREQLGRALWQAGDSYGALAACEEAMAMMPADPPTADRARVVAGYGQLLMLLDRWRRSRAVCEEAIDIARRVGAREAEGHALNTLGLDLVAEGRCEEGFASLRLACDIARETGNVDDIGRAYANLTDALFFGGEVERAAVAVEEGAAAADAVGVATTYGAFIRHNGTLINFDLGRWDVAEEYARAAFATTQERTLGERYGLARMLPLVVARGRFDVAEVDLRKLGEMLEGASVEAQFNGGYRAARAELALWQGRPAEAMDAVEVGLVELEHSEWAWNQLRLHRLGARAAADAAEVARARRDAAAERKALERAARLRENRAETVARSLTVQAGPQADETLAEAATAAAEDRRLVGEPDPGAWADAVGRWRARRRPYLLAYCGWRHAEALLATGDRAGAVDVLREAAAIAGDLGAEPLRAAIASLARRSRIELAEPGQAPAEVGATPEGTAPAAAADPFGLTRREREVLGLVALGRTNRQIADELFISENTAGVHVSNILGKLGVASRTEAAGVAVRLGLAAPEVDRV